jgi:hypothetical protein
MLLLKSFWKKVLINKTKKNKFFNELVLSVEAGLLSKIVVEVVLSVISCISHTLFFHPSSHHRHRCCCVHIYICWYLFPQLTDLSWEVGGMSSLDRNFKFNVVKRYIMPWCKYNVCIYIYFSDEVDFNSAMNEWAKKKVCH